MKHLKRQIIEGYDGPPAMSDYEEFILALSEGQCPDMMGEDAAMIMEYMARVSQRTLRQARLEARDIRYLSISLRALHEHHMEPQPREALESTGGAS